MKIGESIVQIVLHWCWHDEILLDVSSYENYTFKTELEWITFPITTIFDWKLKRKTIRNYFRGATATKVANIIKTTSKSTTVDQESIMEMCSTTTAWSTTITTLLNLMEIVSSIQPMKITTKWMSTRIIFVKKVCRLATIVSKRGLLIPRTLRNHLSTKMKMRSILTLYTNY